LGFLFKIIAYGTVLLLSAVLVLSTLNKGILPSLTNLFLIAGFIFKIPSGTFLLKTSLVVYY
jgi:hypothetical protein